MGSRRVVLDTCVIVAALRSRLGASFEILSRVGTGKFSICVSVPLVLEYEVAGKRSARAAGLKHKDIAVVVDYLCSVAELREIHYLWRPVLRDASDDMVLELAVESHADSIVTFNTRDFIGCENFGVAVMTPQTFLSELRTDA